MSLLLRSQKVVAVLAHRFGMPVDWYLIPLGAIIGCLTGVVAVGFHKMVALSEAFFFGSIHSNPLVGWRIILLLLIPATGGLLVGFIQHFIQRTGPSHGIPDIIEALARKGGVLRLKMGLFTAIKTSLTLGSGGSTGVEGPIVQIGAVLGSVAGRHLHVRRSDMGTLVGCGVAAGLAALFNAPIASVIFVLEVILRDFSLKTFMPIVVASVFGTAVAHALLGGDAAVFNLPHAISDYDVTLSTIWLYAFIGIACGFVAFAYTKAMIVSEHYWLKTKIHPSLRPACGGLCLGILGVGFRLCFGYPIPGYGGPPNFYGNGYEVVEVLLNPAYYGTPTGPHLIGTAAVLTLHILFLMCLLKLVATALTIGSGGAGGIFAPSLFIGAALGGFIGEIAQQLLHLPGFTPATCALAGMAGVLAGAVHCPLTAFLLVFEITRDYKLILPVMLVSILGTSIATILNRDHLYAAILRERGISVGSFSDLTLLRRLQVLAVPLHPAITIVGDRPVQELIDRSTNSNAVDYTICDNDGRYVGIVTGDDLLSALLQPESIPLIIASDLIKPGIPSVTKADTLEKALDIFARHEVNSLAVVDDDQRPIGLISRSRLMRHYQQALNA